MHLDERCAVVALTHDPKLDDLALMEALKSPAFYVGALGSRANNTKRRERLREFEVTRRRDRAAARSHRPLHRKPDAAGDRRFHPRRDHGGEERCRAAGRCNGGRGQGKDRAVPGMPRHLISPLSRCATSRSRIARAGQAPGLRGKVRKIQRFEVACPSSSVAPRESRRFFAVASSPVPRFPPPPWPAPDALCVGWRVRSHGDVGPAMAQTSSDDRLIHSGPSDRADALGATG